MVTKVKSRQVKLVRVRRRVYAKSEVPERVILDRPQRKRRLPSRLRDYELDNDK